MIKNFAVSPAPHLRTPASVPSLYWSAVSGLIPFCLVLLIHKPLETLYVFSLVLASAFGADRAACFFLKKKIKFKKGDTVLYAVLLAGLIPPDAGIGSILAVSFFVFLIGKEFYGGTSHLWIHPSALGRALLILTFPALRTSEAWPLAFWNPFTDFWTFLMTLSLFGGGIFLVIRKKVFWQLPLVYLAGVLIPCLWMGIHAEFSLPLILLSAFWLIPDPVTTPVIRAGQLYFSIVAAVLTLLFGVLGVPSAPVFALLFMNLLTPWMDEWVLPGGISFEAKVQGSHR